MDTVALIQAELRAKDASLERLRRMIFGAGTETTRSVLGEGASEPGARAPQRPVSRRHHAANRPVVGAMPPPRIRAPAK